LGHAEQPGQFLDGIPGDVPMGGLDVPDHFQEAPLVLLVLEDDGFDTFHV
jgi:hypothetical protein